MPTGNYPRLREHRTFWQEQHARLSCPIGNCKYVTPDGASADLILLLMQLHSKEHDDASASGSGAGDNDKSSALPSASSGSAFGDTSRSGSSDNASASGSGTGDNDESFALPSASSGSAFGDTSRSGSSDNASASGSVAGDNAESSALPSASSGSAFGDTSRSGSSDKAESSASHDRVVNVKSVTNRVAVQMLQWPMKFYLPKENFRSSLRRALAESRPLHPGEKEKLMDSLYESVTRFTYRPTPTQYGQVISCLLTSYPALKNGLVGEDAMGYWRKALSNKFRNTRKRHEKNNPLAQPILKKPKTSTSPKPAVKQMYGVKNYLPSPPEGEDEDSINQHVEMMKKEAKKTRQDAGLIDKLMGLTLAHRREGIVRLNWTVPSLKSMYPCLFYEDEMFKEFERLTEAKSIKATLSSGLNKYANAIFELVKTRGLETKNKIAEAEAAEEDEDTRKLIRSSGALLLVPTLLGERDLVCLQSKAAGPMAQILCGEGEGEGTESDKVLQILQSSSFSISVENEKVCSCDNLLSAATLLLLVHYNFNLAYHKKMMCTLTFIQKVLMNIDTVSPAPPKVVRCMYNLNRVLAAQGSK